MTNSQKTIAEDGKISRPTAAVVPVTITNDGQLITVSLRDWFAGQALNQRLTPGWSEEVGEDPRDIKSVAEECYAIADAMLAERNK